MTSLVAWVGVDTHRPASLWIASDSRITFPSGAQWDTARKLFACRTVPVVMGYCGEVIFTVQALDQVVAMLDSGTVIGPGATAHELIDAVTRTVHEAFAGYPTGERKPLEIIVGIRDAAGMQSSFHLYHLFWDGSWKTRAHEAPASSAPVIVRGSGRERVVAAIESWKATHAGGTSRAVFSAFCDSLRIDPHPDSGGAPQVVGLIRKPGSCGITPGVIFGERMYFQGLPAEGLKKPTETEWFNDLFELCDPATMKRRTGAATHVRPETGRRDGG